ncbi:MULTISPECIES: WXG100-like domain-containing protein [unclassified Streptosporangium]|uniref:WXG100-like domain-containing protein n=1 Tax=unclassified Streptosporangium TaxID=2632669 RepID=UPI002E2CAE62|nr:MULTISPECIES: hypothetical protein [unclassified Streptosporangium]
MSGIGAFVKAHPFTAGMGIGAIGSAAMVTTMLGVSWPEGDPDRLRDAADTLDGLAVAIERAGGDADDAATRARKFNSGPSMEEFAKVWESKLRPYPRDIAAHCRAVAVMCREYAQAVETTRYVLKVLAVQAFLNMLFTVAWGWGTVGVASAVQKQLIEKVFRGRAILQKKLFSLAVEKITYGSAYYLADSVGYAGIQQAIQWSVFEVTGVQKDLNGTEVTSLGENTEQFGRNFVANVAFDGTADLAKAAGLPANRAGGLLARLLASGVYTTTDNALQGDFTGPTVEQWLSKLVVHGARTTRPVGP